MNNYAGQDLKFQITSEFAGFTLADDDFTIVIRNRWGQVKYTVEKDECFQDANGRFYMTMENVQVGYYHAEFTGSRPDDDYDKLTQVIKDIQPLTEVVVRCSCRENATFVADDCQCDHKIHYKQVYEVNLDDGTYLADKDGNLILTSDGARIQIKPKQ